MRSGLVKMADREVRVPADQNLQAAQATAVLNQPPPPPAQNPEEQPANPQNAAAEEVTLEVCLIFCLCLNSVLLREHVLSSSPL